MTRAALSEFELIARYLSRPTGGERIDVAVGNGDDCAVLTPTPGHQIAISVDTSVSDVHFPHDAPPAAIGHRALAVALSDLAAMGARARWCCMALTLPAVDEDWVEAFAEGFQTLALRSGCAWIGGDVTRGQLAVSVTVHGELPAGSALKRSGAKPGDVIAVTGYPGRAAAGLERWQQGERDETHPLLAAYLRPEPRLAAGEALRGLAHAAIDISDGLVADLRHLMTASGVAARLEIESLPLATPLRATLETETVRRLALGGGDDYELLLTLNESDLPEAQRRLAALHLPLTAVGRVVEGDGIHGLSPTDLAHDGWDHFPEVAS
ncbi:thiamine-phosphate kinase [Salinicola rhizosphaerae]|uniref:Thiamine-monophosphate kinase n=1 Tax=Salinicola rhizosphaerae TaxID=1443141 RepID=A0ABQ3E411_9GAMM|nr:thiamine-phosphate kinase [Salinicola rhizosphaerae]GHB25215.1 thiamine-monophosphate kinase [Salinicola rhizosphaerae]